MPAHVPSSGSPSSALSSASSAKPRRSARNGPATRSQSDAAPNAARSSLDTQVCPWIEAPSTWTTQTDTRRRSIAEPSPAPVHPSRAAKRSTSDGRTVCALPTLVSFCVSNPRTAVEFHMTLGVGLALQCNIMFSVPWSSIPSPVIAFFPFAGAPVEFHSCLSTQQYAFRQHQLGRLGTWFRTSERRLPCRQRSGEGEIIFTLFTLTSDVTRRDI